MGRVCVCVCVCACVCACVHACVRVCVCVCVCTHVNQLEPCSFRGYQQQDAHEFMHYLLDRVHAELLLSQKGNYGLDTIVTGIFGGILQSEVSCE